MSALLALACVFPAAVASAAGPRLTFRLGALEDERPAVVTAVAMSADARLVAAAGDDHAVRLWDTRDGRLVQTFAGHHDWVRAAQFSPDASRLATVGADRTLRVWSINLPATPAPDPVLVKLAGGPLQAVAFNAPGDRLATVGFGEALRVYAAESGDELAAHHCSCDDTRAVAFSPDGARVAAGGRDGVVRVWDVDSSGPAIELAGDGRRVRAVAFAPSGDVLAVAGDGPAVRLWRLGRPTRPSMAAGGGDPVVEEILTRPGKNHALAFVSDRVIAVGGTSDRIRLLDTSTRTGIAELRGHTGTVASLAASPDGRTLVSGSFDTTVRVWELDPSQGGGRVAARGDTPEAVR